jgi:2-dehydro-3-deoxygluconokinase
VQPDQIDWDYLLDTQILHLTGITPALAVGCLEIAKEAIRRARKQGVALSFDVNYRSKLWSAAEAANTLLPLLQEVDLLLCGLRDACTLFGCDPDPETAVEQMVEKSKAKQIVITLADQGVIGWDGTNLQRQPALPVQMVDRLGAGDALAAGVLHGWLKNDFATGLRYGTLLAALALTQHGDMVITSQQEVASLINKTDGLVVR